MTSIFSKLNAAYEARRGAGIPLLVLNTLADLPLVRASGVAGRHEMRDDWAQLERDELRRAGVIDCGAGDSFRGAPYANWL